MDLFQVESIISRRRVDNQTQLLIRWLGYHEDFDTWEPEQNFTNENMPDIEIQEDFYDEINHIQVTSNWVNIDHILHLIHVLRKQFIRRDSNIRVIYYYDELPKMDSIILKIINHHVYVIYYRPNNISYICDGANDIFILRNLKKSMQKEFKDIKLIRYHSQERDDHCMSSAILATLQFINSSKRGDFYNDEIVPSSRLKLRLIKKLHPNKSSAKLITWRPVNQQPGFVFKCANCGKSFHRIKKQIRKLAMIMHEKKCKKT